MTLIPPPPYLRNYWVNNSRKMQIIVLLQEIIKKSGDRGVTTTEPFIVRCAWTDMHLSSFLSSNESSRPVLSERERTTIIFKRTARSHEQTRKVPVINYNFNFFLFQPSTQLMQISKVEMANNEICQNFYTIPVGPQVNITNTMVCGNRVRSYSSCEV